jgi:hypothetical protein
MSVVSCIIRTSKEMENKLSNIGRTGELIANLKKSGIRQELAHAYAFGLVWAMLTEKQMEQALDFAERKAKGDN